MVRIVLILLGVVSLWARAGELDPKFLVAAPAKRVALVIGAEHYAPCGQATAKNCLPDVRNALNDADEVARALRQAGFSSVKVVPDPRDDDEIYDYVEDLAQRAGPNDEPAIVVFFFAGHGFQSKSRNYIAAPNVTEDDIKAAIPIDSLIKPFANRQAGIAIFFFDSCRTETSLKMSDGIGFNQALEYQGTVQVFATQFNQTASSAADDKAINSPYSGALRKYIPYSSPDFSFAKALERVRIYVNEQTLSKRPPQVPTWIPNANITGFYLHPTAADEAKEAELWRATLSAGTARCVRAYKESHPGSSFLKRAIEWLSQVPPGLQQETVAACPYE